MSQPAVGVPAEVPFLLHPWFQPLAMVGEVVAVGLTVGWQVAFIFGLREWERAGSGSGELVALARVAVPLVLMPRWYWVSWPGFARAAAVPGTGPSALVIPGGVSR